MSEQRLEEKQFDLVLGELRRIADQLDAIRDELGALENLPAALHELSRLAGAIESLAYAALGRDGPSVRRRA